MNERPEKQGFLGRTTRFFTRKDRDAYSDINFLKPEHIGDESAPAIESPDDWSAEATAVFAESALCPSVPSRTRAVEENTVPSWLWQRTGHGAGRKSESGTREVFDRVVGSAVYSAWKNGLLADENEARTVFDELRFMLARRAVAIEPHALAQLGLGWAYGSDKKPASAPASLPSARNTIDVSNTLIDAMVSGTASKAMHLRRQKLRPTADMSSVRLRLSDIAADWGTPQDGGIRGSLDLMAFRHNNGWINIDAMRQATRLVVILLDMHSETLGRTLDLGFHNLSPLLMALALPYDSDGGRAVAAGISAIITSEAYATSAELAGLLGSSPEYAENRETVLRGLRNRRRAAYGDRNDYEKISVLPVPLLLEHAPDLALVAVAQRRWEDALQLTRVQGLRHIQVTSLGTSPALTVFTESAQAGIAPMASLAPMRPAGRDLFRREISSSVTEAVARLGYDQSTYAAVARYVAGSGVLEKAPSINHTSLRAHGFDAAALARVESYLGYVGDVRLAITHWILGEDFCRKSLKISPAKLANPRFDLVKHLGFTAADVAAANIFVYGHNTLRGTKEIRQQHLSVFAHGGEVTPEARIRMAASVQSFVSGDVALSVSLPQDGASERSEQLLLGAWRQGVKSLTVDYDALPLRKTVVEKKVKRASTKVSPSVFIHTKKHAPLPVRGVRQKAGGGLLSMRSKGKPAPSTRGKRS